MLVAFDYDGVLADTLNLVVDFAHAFCHGRHDRETLIRLLNELNDVTFPEFAKVCDITDIDAFCAGIAEELGHRGGEVTLFPGMAEVVTNVSGHHRVAIISASPGAVIEAVLQREQLTNCVSDILGANAPGSKSDKLKALRNNSAAPREDSLVMIGDSVSDIRQAKLADALSIGVTWGWQSAERLSAEEPTHLVDSPQQLGKLLARLDSR
jgi:phosphoglycolate phosphatase-like HAD superfamily hydrolase